MGGQHVEGLIFQHMIEDRPKDPRSWARAQLANLHLAPHALAEESSRCVDLKPQLLIQAVTNPMLRKHEPAALGGLLVRRH